MASRRAGRRRVAVHAGRPLRWGGRTRVTPGRMVLGWRVQAGAEGGVAAARACRRTRRVGGRGVRVNGPCGQADAACIGRDIGRGVVESTRGAGGRGVRVGAAYGWMWDVGGRGGIVDPPCGRTGPGGRGHSRRTGALGGGARVDVAGRVDTACRRTQRARRWSTRAGRCGVRVDVTVVDAAWCAFGHGVVDVDAPGARVDAACAWARCTLGRGARLDATRRRTRPDAWARRGRVGAAWAAALGVGVVGGCR